jgi:hypothetical protein
MHASGAYVVIGEDEPVGRDEAGGSSRNAYAGESQMVEEGLSDDEFIASLDAGCGKCVVEPHAFIGEAGYGTKQNGKVQDKVPGGEALAHKNISGHFRWFR